MENRIEINGIRYVRADAKEGARHVVVVDRGWIFAGNLTRENGRVKLTDALHVFKWESIGFAKMVETAQADLRPIDDVDLPEVSEIFAIQVSDSWGK